VAPYIPVAAELARRGHEVTFLAPEGFRSILDAPEQPFAYRPYALDFSAKAMHADPRHERLMRHPYRNSARLGRYWMGLGFGNDPAAGARSLREAFDGADVVVTHPTFGSVSIPAARGLCIPVAVGHLFPMMIPTRRWGPPLGPTNPNLTGPLNRAAWWTLRTASGPIFQDREVNRFRSTLGQPPRRGNAGWAFVEAERTVMLVSRYYFGEAPDDWPPLTWGGFSWWDGPPLQPEVQDFLDEAPDDPPVLVTLGTSAASGAGEAFARIAADLDAAGLRSLLLVGDEQNLAPLRGRAGAFTFASVARALPRCRVAVLSGALGGLAAALRAGVPIVVLPQLFDQVWHGRRVRDLGLGLHVRRPDQVAAAVRAIAADDGFARRAAAFAARLREEDGAGALADAAEHRV
jgi:UDP:flavonoid glycosyltransferase YjiC (YdhE family)